MPREFPSLHRERQSEMVVEYSSLLLLFTTRLKYRSTRCTVAHARRVRLSVSCGDILQADGLARRAAIFLCTMFVSRESCAAGALPRMKFDPLLLRNSPY